MNNKSTNRLVLLFIILVVVGFTPACYGAAKPIQARVSISSPVYVKEGTVYLKDIAAISCDNDELKAKLDKVIVGPAPQPGDRNRVRKDLLSVRIRQQRIDPDIIELDVPVIFELVSALKEFSAQDVYRTAIAAISTKLNIDSEKMVYKAVKMPSGLVSVAPSSQLSSEIVGVDGQNRYSVKISTQSGDSTVAIIEVLTDNGTNGFTPISDSSAQGISKGQDVVVIASSGGVTVTVLGIASESANVGQKIRVSIPSLKKTLYGVVEDTKTVTISVP